MASKQTEERSRSRSPVKRNIKNKRILVSNIPYTFTTKALRDLFKEKIGICGQIEFIEHNGKFSGNAIVEFRTLDGAQKAVSEMHKQVVEGRDLVVREETPKDRNRFGLNAPMYEPVDLQGGQNNSLMQLIDHLQRDGPITNSLFMANLHYSLTWQKLKDMFKEAGRVKHVDLKVDNDGSSRGFGTVEFETPEEAILAIHKFNGQNVNGRDIKLRMDKSGKHLVGRLDMSWFRENSNRGSDLNPAIRRTFEDLMQAISNPGNNTPQAMKAINELVLISQMFDKQNVPASRFPPVEPHSFGSFDRPVMNQGMKSWNEPTHSFSHDYMRSQQIESYKTPFSSDMGRNGREMRYSPPHPSINPSMQHSTSNDMALLEDLLTKYKNSDQQALLSVLSNVLSKKGSEQPPMPVAPNMPRFNEFSSALSNTLLVKNIPFSFTWKDLKHSFSQAPGILNIEILRDEFNRSKGVGLVMFQTSTDAQRCKNLMDGTLLDGRPINIEFSHSIK